MSKRENLKKNSKYAKRRAELDAERKAIYMTYRIAKSENCEFNKMAKIVSNNSEKPQYDKYIILGGNIVSVDMLPDTDVLDVVDDDIDWPSIVPMILMKKN
jgi:hypothetical protein